MKESFINQSIIQRINQSVHRYSVPSEVEKDTALKSLLNKISERQRSEKVKTESPGFIRFIASMAAVLVVGMVLWVAFGTKNIRNESLNVASFRLPDQSRVVLDSKSSVSFHRFFTNRKVKLTGKGYFEVEKGSRFRVFASGGFVEVLGTRFLVDRNQERLEVLCYEGKVKAAFHKDDEILPAGSGVKFTENEDKIKLTGKEPYPDFAMFEKQYHNENVRVVMNDIEQFFDVKIINQLDKQRYFTGSINTGNLDMALSIVTASLQVDFERLKKNNFRIY